MGSPARYSPTLPPSPFRLEQPSHALHLAQSDSAPVLATRLRLPSSPPAHATFSPCLNGPSPASLRLRPSAQTTMVSAAAILHRLGNARLPSLVFAPHLRPRRTAINLHPAAHAKETHDARACVLVRKESPSGN